jgi:hypothetical protein
MVVDNKKNSTNKIDSNDSPNLENVWIAVGDYVNSEDHFVLKNIELERRNLIEELQFRQQYRYSRFISIFTIGFVVLLIIYGFVRISNFNEPIYYILLLILAIFFALFSAFNFILVSYKRKYEAEVYSTYLNIVREREKDLYDRINKNTEESIEKNFNVHPAKSNY